VPGLSGVTGNGTTDLAKCGAESPFIGPEPACSIPGGAVEVHNWTKTGEVPCFRTFTKK